MSSLSNFIDQEAWQNFYAGQKQVILGRGVANELNVAVGGDYITLMIPQTGGANKVQAPKRVRVKVSGFLTLNGQIDHSLALVPLADAQQYARLGEGVTGISLKTDDVLNAPSIVREVGSMVDVYVYLKSWQQKFGFYIAIYNSCALLCTW